jgi:adenylate cyclase
LGVAYLVQGSVRRAGNRVRVNAQLIEGSTDGHLWAERYDRYLTDIFAVQDEITGSIVEELKVRLLPHEKEAIERCATKNIEAYTHYLRGRQLFHMGTKQSLGTARQMFRRASELDPNYARAYAGIADCDSRLYSKHGMKLSVSEILATVDKALSIDPGSAEAHAARGYALMVANRRDEALHALERALALDPGCHEAHYHYADYCVTAGDFEGAARNYIRALELKPDDYISPVLLLNILRTLGRMEEAEAYAPAGVEASRRGAEAPARKLKARPAGCSSLGHAR